jgi:hypothetical protein
MIDLRIVFIARALHELVAAGETLDNTELEGLMMIVNDIVTDTAKGATR